MFKKTGLSQPQRLIVAAIYLIIIFICILLLGENPVDLIKGSTDESIWFYSGVLLIIMGQYVTEPFFSTPADAFANSITAILALIAVHNKQSFKLYWVIFVYCCIVCLLSIVAIGTNKYNNRFSKTVYFLTSKMGCSKVLFSLIYLLSAFAYFFNPDKCLYFAVSMVLWMCIIFFNIVEHIVSFFASLIRNIKTKPDVFYLGQAIKSSDQIIYSLEIDKHNFNSQLLNCKAVAVKATKKECYIGTIIRKQTYINTYYIDIVLIADNGSPKILPVKDVIAIHNFSNFEVGAVFALNDVTCKDTDISQLLNDTLITNKNHFVGLVKTESNINTIRFSILNNEKNIREGKIIKVNINGCDVLYQIINGITKETLDTPSDSFGYICGEARKLGAYDYKTNLLKSVPWLPNTYEKVYLLNTNFVKTDLKEIADSSIGVLPGTDMRIPINDINNLVTHNTAILGILGVGKSCLTFELIIKIIKTTNCKVVCIDITNQYYSEDGLFSYIDKDTIQNDFTEGKLTSLNNDATKTGSKSRPSEWGNTELYRSEISDLIKNFFDSDKQILIFNPDKHKATQAAGKFNIEELVELTTVEKTRIISEELLSYCMEKGQTSEARCAIVLEEAHSLVPEWNSVSSAGDQNATNGTAKVILQGRKYGLGCILVTQRTANVTKSILNQCNTIFAMRVFDDTGKSFLENYIGSDYSSTLPTLEERHAIVMGKSLGLKQPILIQLNDKKYFNSN